MIFNLDQVIVNGVPCVVLEIMEIAVLQRRIRLVLLPLLMIGCVAQAVQLKPGGMSKADELYTHDVLSFCIVKSHTAFLHPSLTSS